MLTLTREQFAAKIQQHSAELSRLIAYDLPRIIGREAVKHFKLNFQNEGWERDPWPEVKRRQAEAAKKGKKGQLLTRQPASFTRKILTGKTGDLGRSIQYTPENAKVTIHTELIYAAVHNFGLKAGRGKGFTMPKRQFIGDSEELNDKIKDIIETKVNIIFNK